jgi:predicted DNA-binding protein YlxM (UPF0122 family)
VAKVSKSRKSLEEERIRIAALIRAYGSLLTQRQLSLAQQFCMEGKNFSQIARERDVSRQAVHEAIRSVQQQLELFEMKLRLVEKGGIPTLPQVEAIHDQIRAIRQRLSTGDVLGQAGSLVSELDQLLVRLQEALVPVATRNVSSQEISASNPA